MSKKKKLMPKEPDMIDSLQTRRIKLQHQIDTNEGFTSPMDRSCAVAELKEIKGKLNRFLMDLYLNSRGLK